MSSEIPRVLSGCGILGILRRENAEKIGVEETLSSIECVRYRGSRYGAGFAAYNLDGVEGPRLNKVKVFVDSDNTLAHVKKVLKSKVDGVFYELGFETSPTNRFVSWTALVDASPENLRPVIDTINYELFNAGIRGRVYSWGRFVEVFKGVGYPSDVCRIYGLTEKKVEADLWIAHTRQPTNSPGVYPIWSHPFASHEWAIAHNGDISSFGANMEFIRFRGFRSFVGTDSELIAYLLDYLTNIEKLSVMQAAAVLVNSFENDLLNGGSTLSLGEYVRWHGAGLDGPFSVVAGFCDGEDVYMLAFADRSKFRPMIVGYDHKRFYVASEEAEIRQLSADAVTWTVKPGGVFLATMKKGIISSGREHIEAFYCISTKRLPVGEVVDAAGLSYSRVNQMVRQLFMKGVKEVNVVNVNGHRYLGINVPAGHRLNIFGTAGNCLANFNKGGEITVYGSAQDDVGDAMHGGRVVIHGNAGDVLAQALQGGEIFVRGSAGNRVAIQMREYRENKPHLVVGGRVDDYLGEYMAGGVVSVLGLDAFDVDDCLVGRYVATGMVGGVIYVRGEVERWRIGLQPPVQDVKTYIRGLYLDGLVDEQTYKQLAAMKTITFADVKKLLPQKPLEKISKLFTSKYCREIVVEHRKLGEEDLKTVMDVWRRFFEEFRLDEKLFERLLDEKFTIIKAASSTPSPKTEQRPEEG